MGHVYPRGTKLWLSYMGPDGERSRHPTPFMVGEEKQAEKLLATVEAKVAAGLVPEEGPLTLERYARRWITKRKALGLADWQNDEGRLKLHVLPALGKLRLDEVRPRHLSELFQALRGKRAPKTVRNVYSVLTALFRDAHIDDLIPSSPCVLTKYQLGPVEDADPEWRATALFTRAELERLISDEQIPIDRRVLYALEGIAALRHGEAAGLCWRHYEPDMEPLGRLTVATSYDTGRTKTGRTRFMPVHPTLAAILAEWKLSGWPAMMGRSPGPDDLVVPMPKGPKNKLGDMRLKWRSHHRFKTDLAALGLRHRRGHDLRRTMISLARGDGARKDLLELCTHNPRKGSTIDLYTTFQWKDLCAEVAKLKVSREPRGGLVALPLAAAGNSADSALRCSRNSGGGAGSNSADSADSALRGVGMTVARAVAGEQTQLEPQQVATCWNHAEKIVTPPGLEPGTSA